MLDQGDYTEFWKVTNYDMNKEFLDIKTINVLDEKKKKKLVSKT